MTVKSNIDGQWIIENYVIHNEAMRDAEASHNKEMRDAEASHNKEMRDAEASHNKEMRENDVKHSKEIREADDRRYGEVNVEKEKALLIKTTADDEAMRLARESQVYKDQQSDAMREKNLAASGVYATTADLQAMVDKIEKSLKPLFEFVSAQQGVSKGNEITWGKILGSVGAIGVIIGIIVKFI